MKLELELIGHPSQLTLSSVVEDAVLVDLKNVITEFLLIIVAIKLQLGFDSTEVHWFRDVLQIIHVEVCIYWITEYS